MDLNLANKTALITGASKGIGKGIAMAMAEEGCDIILVSRTLVELNKAATDITNAHNVNVRVFAKDLSVIGAVAELIEEAGTPNILVNNAGAIPGGSLELVEEERWRESWELKVFGYINMCRTFYAAMKKQGHGVIINVTGLAGERLDANYIAGSSGNAGLNAFTRALGSKSLSDGIRVLAVSPGACETERLVGLMRTKAEAEYGDPEHWQSYLGGLPLGRAATVCVVAEVVTFMSSERASYMSGVIIPVDGGYGANN